MIMHYIVGEKQHCVIQEISCDESKECINAVQLMVQEIPMAVR